MKIASQLVLILSTLAGSSAVAAEATAALEFDDGTVIVIPVPADAAPSFDRVRILPGLFMSTADRCAEHLGR